MHILGISAFYHDSAACLVRDGEIIAAAQEERFTRKKHDPGFPHRAVEYCLNEGRIGIKDLQYIVFYDKPLIKFERLLETYVGFAPRGLQSFLAAMPVWLKEKLLLRNLLRKEILACDPGLNKKDVPQFLFGEHHGEEGWINGGFYVLQKKAIDYVDGDDIAWEKGPIDRLTKERQLMGYRHERFWSCMDTLKEKTYLEDLWQSGKAPWKIW